MKDSIIIYGAHLVALECYRNLCVSGYKDRVIGFAVTDMKDNPLEIEGLPVKCINDYSQYADNCRVLIAMPGKYHNSVEENLKKQGFGDIKRFSLENMSEIKGQRLIRDYPLPFELTESRNDPTWLDAFADGTFGKIRCKFPTLFYLDDKEMIKKSVKMYDIFKDEIERVSDLKKFSSGEEDFKPSVNKPVQVPSLNIFMAFDSSVIEHVKKRSFDPWIKPLQVGCINTVEKYGDFFDDQCENSLADNNPILAEMTGAYWIWKQGMGSEYKGLCHYRRFFDITVDDIKIMKAENIDVLLTTPRFVPGGIRGMFTSETPVKEPVMKAMLSAIEELSSEDRSGFEEYLERSFYFPNNMVVARSEIYDSYCEWVFPILLRMIEIDIETGYGHKNDRHIAYAAELLTSFYFIKRIDKYNVAFTDYIFIDQ